MWSLGYKSFILLFLHEYKSTSIRYGCLLYLYEIMCNILLLRENFDDFWMCKYEGVLHFKFWLVSVGTTHGGVGENNVTINLFHHYFVYTLIENRPLSFTGWVFSCLSYAIVDILLAATISTVWWVAGMVKIITRLCWNFFGTFWWC